MIPTVFKVAGEDNVRIITAVTGAEDFSFYAEKVPGFFYFLGGKPHDVEEGKVFPHLNPDFFIDESGLILGVKKMANLALDYGKNSL